MVLNFSLFIRDKPPNPRAGPHGLVAVRTHGPPRPACWAAAADALRHHFRRSTGVSPRHYRGHRGDEPAGSIV